MTKYISVEVGAHDIGVRDVAEILIDKLHEDINVDILQTYMTDEAFDCELEDKLKRLCQYILRDIEARSDD